MDNFSQLPEELLQHIFSFLVPEPFELDENRSFRPARAADGSYMSHAKWGEFLESRSALNALTSTSRLAKRLSFPLLHQNVVFTSMRSVMIFLTLLLARPERGRWVKQITWLLPPPSGVVEGPSGDGVNILARIDQVLRRNVMFHGLPDPREDDFAGRAVNYLKLVLRDHLDNFPAGRLGAIGFPLLSLTPNLTTLNISGYQDWWMARRAEVMDDPFFGFLEARAAPDRTGFAELMRYLFPDHIFALVRDDRTGCRTGLVFPPPHLATIVRCCPSLINTDRQAGQDEEPDAAYNFVTERLSVFPHGAAKKLRVLTIRMKRRLQIPFTADRRLENANFLAPSNILRADAVKFLDICKYLDFAGSLVKNEDCLQYIKNLKALPISKRDSIASPLRLKVLDEWGADFRDWIVELHESVVERSPFVLGLVVRCSLLDLLEHGRNEEPRPSVTDLTVSHPDNVWIPFSMTGVETGDTLGLCIARQMPSLETLTLDLRLYIGNRTTVFHRFNPCAFECVRELTITVEALWGPVTTVLHMLSGDADLDDDDDSPAARGVRKTVWEMRRKAVERLPKPIKTLRLMDWFAEYHHPDIETHFDADREEQGIGRAPANNNAAPENPHDPVAHTPFYEYPAARSPYPDREGGFFSPTFGVRPPSPAPNPYREAVDRNASAEFTQQYILALAYGLLELCAQEPPFSSKPLIKSLRPDLKTIEFVYCLQSKDPTRRDDPQALKSDTLWRGFCDTRGGYSMKGYEHYRNMLRILADIEFAIWEGWDGNPPSPPDADGQDDSDMIMKDADADASASENENGDGDGDGPPDWDDAEAAAMWEDDPDEYYDPDLDRMDID